MTVRGLTVEFSPTTGPFETPVWVSLSEGGPHGNRVLSAEWVDGRQADLSEFPAGQATIVLTNDDRLFDPEFQGEYVDEYLGEYGGIYAGLLQPRVPFRIRYEDEDGDEYGDEYESGYGGSADLFYGFVEDGWEQNYQPPEGSTCIVKLVDLLAVIAGYKLPSVLETEILADSPVGYWPLDDQSDLGMRDRSESRFDGSYVSGSAALAGSFGDLPTKGLHLDSEHSGLVHESSLTITYPLVVEAFAMADGDELADIGGLFYGSGNGSPSSGAYLQWVATGDDNFSFQARNYGVSTSGVSATIGPSDQHNDPHHLAYRLVAPSDPYLYIDGEDTGATPQAGSSIVFSAEVGTRIGGWRRAGIISQFTGWLSHVAVFDTDIGAVRIAAHAEAALAPLSGLRSDEQVEWILETIGVPASLFDLDVGQSTMPPLNSAGRDALELIREITNTEQGAFFVDHSNGGVLKFRQRYASFQDTRSTVVQAVFTDDPAATGTYARVEPGTLQVEPNGIQTVINQAAVTWSGGQETVDISAGSPYGPRSVSINTQSATPSIARSVGEWIVALNSTPSARIRSLGINPGANTSEFPIALGTQIGDRVSYRSHPQVVGSATTKELEVQGRRHRVQDLHWETTFYLTKAPNDGVTLFTWDDSLLDGDDILAY